MPKPRYIISSRAGGSDYRWVPYDVEKGSAVFIPGGVKHSVVNREREELRLVYVFPTGRFGDIVYHFTPGSGRAKL